MTSHYTTPEMPAFDVLRQYLSERATFTADDFAFMEPVFLPMALKADEFLQRAGEVAKYAAFVASGCLRSYVIDGKGKEHIVQFAPETWWLADSTSLAGKTPSQYFYQAIEDSELLLIDPMSHEMLVRRLPPYAQSFQTGLQKHAAAKDQRHRDVVDQHGGREVSGVPADLFVDRLARAAVDARVVSRPDARDAEPRPEESIKLTLLETATAGWSARFSRLVHRYTEAPRTSRTPGRRR